MKYLALWTLIFAIFQSASSHSIRRLFLLNIEVVFISSVFHTIIISIWVHNRCKTISFFAAATEIFLERVKIWNHRIILLILALAYPKAQLLYLSVLSAIIHVYISSKKANNEWWKWKVDLGKKTMCAETTQNRNQKFHSKIPYAKCLQSFSFWKTYLFTVLYHVEFFVAISFSCSFPYIFHFHSLFSIGERTFIITSKYFF